MKLTRPTKRLGTALLSGGLLFGSGTCVPDNFWIDTWGAALSATADTALATYVLDPVFATDPGPLEVDLVEDGD